MSAVLVGIDIGTSACKVAAFDLEGRVLAQANDSYRVYYPEPSWAEQNPDEWWQAVCRATRSVLDQGIAASEIQGIGVDGQSWSAIPIDKKGEVLCNTPIWMDRRAVQICEQMKAQFGEEKLFATSGNPVQAMFSMPKVLWYKEHRPQVYQHTYKVLQSNSFIVYRLTDALTQEPSQGYGWNCYQMESGQWDKDLCAALGVDPGFLPDIVPCHALVGAVSEKAARESGLLAGTPVVAGGLDAACGTLGAGVLHPGETQEQGGQAGGMSICMDRYHADMRLILSAHVVPKRWLLQGGTVGGGGALNWFEREFAAAERSLAEKNGTNAFFELDQSAADIPAGSDGLLFLPYLAGERSPIWDADAKGVFYGVSFSTTRAHFARAVMEGVAYSLRHNIEVAKEAGADVRTLRAMGGAANSRLWTQIKADVTACDMVVPSSDTATALGAAILAGVGTAVYADFDEAAQKTIKIKREFLPCPENKARYDQAYAQYRKLYEQLKDMMREV